MVTNCPFCLENKILEGEILFEDTYVYAVSSIDRNLNKAGMIVTRRHIQTPFDLNENEEKSIFKIMKEIKKIFDERYRPDGFMIGWNVGDVAGQNVEHAHLHIIGRFKGEKYEGKGLRYLFKQNENTRD